MFAERKNFNSVELSVRKCQLSTCFFLNKTWLNINDLQLQVEAWVYANKDDNEHAI